MDQDNRLKESAIALMSQLNSEMKIRLNSSNNFLNPGPMLPYIKRYFAVWEMYQSEFTKEEFLRYSKKWIFWYASTLATTYEHLKDLVIGTYDYNATRQPHKEFLMWIHEWDEDFSHQLMMKHPGAYVMIDEDWALWTRLIA